jgi:hypothetical protein
MQGQVLVSFLPLRAWIACCAALLAFGANVPGAQAARALVNAEVPAAKWKAIKLRNLPQGAKVGIQAESPDGGIDLIFIHGEELKRFPAAVSPEFQGSVERKLSFSAVISKKGDYYIILDNRRGSEARKVRLLIRAERTRRPQGSTAPDATGTKKGDTEI